MSALNNNKNSSFKKSSNLKAKKLLKWKPNFKIDKALEKILEQETKLFCENVSGYWNNNENKLKKKNVKKYELKGERSIALSWDGYSNLIAGTVEFDETDYKGILNIPLPNNDGNCEGSYSLQENGKGTWQISCTNNMGAAGTLKWIRNGGVTGAGRDHNDKKVKFTVSKKG